jgi:hypothetical protein
MFVFADSKLEKLMPLEYTTPKNFPTVLPVQNNTITPIFNKDQWPLAIFDTTSPNSASWASLQPMLLLASRMLECEPTMSVLRKIRYGNQVKDKTSGRFYLQYKQPKTVAARNTHNGQVQKDLVALKDKLGFVWGAPILSDQSPAQIHAMHVVSLSEKKVLFQRRRHYNALEKDGEKHYIIVNDVYRQYFNQSAQRRGPNRSPLRDAKTIWTGASTMVHEVIHVYFARDRTDGNETYKEPYFTLEEARTGERGFLERAAERARKGNSQEEKTDKGDQGELGDALDFTLYNAHINCITLPTTGSECETYQHDVSWTKNGAEVAELKRPGFLIYPIPPSWFLKQLKDDFWTSEDQTDKLLHVTIPQHAVGRIRKRKRNGFEDWEWVKVDKPKGFKGSMLYYQRKRDEMLKEELETAIEIHKQGKKRMRDDENAGDSSEKTRRARVKSGSD